MTDLATEIETSPPTRELADRVLIACGWVVAGGAIGMPVGPGALFPKIPPDPLTDLNAIAALEREAGADIWSLTTCTVDPARATVRVVVGKSHGVATATGPHAECRARAAALVRALAAAGKG